MRKKIYSLMFAISYFMTSMINAEISMEEFLKEYYHSNEKNIENYSKLLYSTSKNYRNISMKLLNAGENPNFADSKDQTYTTTPFLFAIINNDIALVEAMIKNGADVNLRSGLFESFPLRASVEYRCVCKEITKLLCDAGAKSTKFPGDNYYRNPLVTAMEYLNIDKFYIIAETLSDEEIKVNMKNLIFQTEMIWYIIENGSDKSIQIAEYLIQRGVPIETENFSALSICCKNGNIKLMRYLISNGANVNFIPKIKYDYWNKQYPLIAALDFQQNYNRFLENHNRLEILPDKNEPLLTLLESDIDVNYSISIPNSSILIMDVSPLGFASSEHLNAAIETLINYGADVNFLEKSGKTPLIRAIEANNLDGVFILLSAGADFSQKDAKTGLTPIEIALLIGNQEIFNALVNIEAEKLN